MRDILSLLIHLHSGDEGTENTAHSQIPSQFLLFPSIINTNPPVTACQPVTPPLQILTRTYTNDYSLHVVTQIYPQCRNIIFCANPSNTIFKRVQIISDLYFPQLRPRIHQ